MKIGLELSSQTVPESNATNADFTRTNNMGSAMSGCKPWRDADNGYTNCIVFWIGKSHMYSIAQKQECLEDY